MIVVHLSQITQITHKQSLIICYGCLNPVYIMWDISKWCFSTREALTIVSKILEMVPSIEVVRLILSDAG